jgi:hypothetical protein
VARKLRDRLGQKGAEMRGRLHQPDGHHLIYLIIANQAPATSARGIVQSAHARHQELRAPPAHGMADVAKRRATSRFSSPSAQRRTILARFDTPSSCAVALARLSRWHFSVGVNASAAFGLPLRIG